MGEFIEVQDVSTSFGKYQINKIRILKLFALCDSENFLTNQGPKLVEYPVEFLLNFELTRAKRAAENFDIFGPESKMLF